MIARRMNRGGCRKEERGRLPERDAQLSEDYRQPEKRGVADAYVGSELRASIHRWASLEMGEVSRRARTSSRRSLTR